MASVDQFTHLPGIEGAVQGGKPGNGEGVNKQRDVGRFVVDNEDASLSEDGVEGAHGVRLRSISLRKVAMRFEPVDVGHV